MPMHTQQVARRSMPEFVPGRDTYISAEILAAGYSLTSGAGLVLSTTSLPVSIVPVLSIFHYILSLFCQSFTLYCPCFVNLSN
jgi:hypothetical protein